MDTHSKLFENKASGWIFLNGNVNKEEDLVNMCRERICNPQTFDEKLNSAKKVLLVTAAFQKGHEHHDRHLIESFEKIGIDAGWQNGLPTNIQNLSLWTTFNDFKYKEKWLYQKYTEKQDMIKAFKADYLVKNSSYIDRTHALIQELSSKYPNLSLFEFYSYMENKDNWEYLTVNHSPESAEPILKDLRALSASMPDLDRVKELKAVVDHIIYKDQEIFAACHFMEEYFIEKSGILDSSLYKEQREELNSRIASSATIFLYGGRVYVLVNRLRFYRLAESFQAALDRGSNIYGISAGSICQTDRFFLNMDRFSQGGYLRASDQGMGLVKGLGVTPHAEDYNYIMEADRNALTFFSLRQTDGVMVGLSAKAILAVEKYRDPIDGKIYSRYTSVGDEPVLIFGIRGVKYELKKYSQILLENTKFYTGCPMIGEAEDIALLEQNSADSAAAQNLPEIDSLVAEP